MAGRKKSEKAPPRLVSVSFRLDPRTKFAAEILARSQHRSLASTVEWAISKALASQEVSLGFGMRNLEQLVELVWSPDDLERVLYLGIHAGHLLTHEESCICDVVMSSPALFECHRDDETGRIKDFKIRRTRIFFARNLISERAQQLADTGSLLPIGLDEIERDSNGKLRSIEEQEMRSEHEALSAPDLAMIGHFRLKKTDAGYCFVLLSDSGECLLASPFYSCREEALEKMQTAHKTAEDRKVFFPAILWQPEES